MDLTNKTEIKNLLKRYNAKPEKYLGQHFILSKKALNLMIETAEIRKTDTIIEIGPGLGTLTTELAKTGAKVIAIEKDPLMVQILKETLTEYKNIQVIQTDARDSTGVGLRWKRGKGAAPQLRGESHPEKSGWVDKYKIVANLPYNTATFLIRQWLELENAPELMILMIQKEVAQRICTKPPRANLLGISVQFYADVEIVDYVKKESFWPRPKVDAAIIKIVPTRLPAPDGAADGGQEKQNFFKILKAGFSQPRKQLAGNLAKKLKISKEDIISALKKMDISEQARAENLTLRQWQGLTLKLIHN